MWHFVILTALAGLAGVSPGPAADPKPAPEPALRGTWVITAVGAKGLQFPIEGGAAGAYTFDADGTVVLTAPGFPERKGTFKLDPAKSPKHIDLTLIPKEGEQAEVMQAIYKLDGDTLVVAYPHKAGGQRPAAFDAKDADLMTLKRKKP